MTDTIAMKLENRYGFGVILLRIRRRKHHGKENQHQERDRCQSRIGCRAQESGGKDAWRHADRQKGKLVDPVQDQKLGHARKQNGNRHGDDGGCGKATGLAVLALNAMITPTKTTPSDADGQPPRENRAAEISTARNARSPFRTAARRER